LVDDWHPDCNLNVQSWTFEKNSIKSLPFMNEKRFKELSGKIREQLNRYKGVADRNEGGCQNENQRPA
jgi:hypothetical protein